MNKIHQMKSLFKKNEREKLKTMILKSGNDFLRVHIFKQPHPHIPHRLPFNSRNKCFYETKRFFFHFFMIDFSFFVF